MTECPRTGIPRFDNKYTAEMRLETLRKSYKRRLKPTPFPALRAYKCVCKAWHLSYTLDKENGERRPCPTPRKKPYSSEVIAQKILSAVWTRPRQGGADLPTRAYLCDCERWHLTHLSAEQQEAAERLARRRVV